MADKNVKDPEVQKKHVRALRQRFVDAAHNPIPVSKRQQALIADPGVKGPIWVAKTSLPAPSENDLSDSLWSLVSELASPDAKITRPGYNEQMKAEWTGVRKGAGPKEPLSQMGEKEKFDRLMGEVKGDGTLLFLQGGSFAYGSPATARTLASRLAATAQSTTRILTIAYRLAPQHTFPAPLLDALHAYFSLLSPASDSFHAPVDPSRLTLAGESAGGALALALLQFLLQLRRHGIKTIRFNGRDVPVVLPAAVAGLSVPGDLTGALPSRDKYQEHDWSGRDAPWLLDTTPADAIWPSSPPRGEIFADTSALTHPLLSVAAIDDWTGAPPLFLSTGWECLSDGARVIARRAAQQGVNVAWWEYEFMPHLWMTFLRLPQSGHVMEVVGRFCTGMLKREQKFGGSFVRLGDCSKVESVEVSKLDGVSWEEAQALMDREMKERSKMVWDRGLKPVNGQAKASL